MSTTTSTRTSMSAFVAFFSAVVVLSILSNRNNAVDALAADLLPTPSDLVVKDLDQVVQAFGAFDGTMYAGSLPMDHVSTTVGGANPDGLRTGFLQFWLYVPNHQAAPDTLSAWFNGGPGCSSFSAGILFEHSPVTVPLHEAGWCCEPQNETLTANNYGWTHATTMLYVEQPIGVGFSESTNNTPEPSSEDDVASDFDAFLQTFYKVFNGYDSNGTSGKYDPSMDFTKNKLSLVGESYAGIYIPSVARQIYLNNVASLPNLDGTPRFQTPLWGIAIGNGKIDGLTQDPAIIDFTYWHGLIDLSTRDYLYAEWDHCIDNMETGNVDPKTSEPFPFHPFTVRDDCGILNAVIKAAGGGVLEGTILEGGPNIYEYSTWDGYLAADGDEGTVSKFYNNPAVQKALNVPEHRRSPNHKWMGCIPETRRRLGSLGRQSQNNVEDNNHRRLNFMAHDTPWSVTPYIGQLLDEANIQVLIYSGDRDIICCTQGSEEALRKMDWSGTREIPPGAASATPQYNAWTAAPRGLWMYNDYPAGYVKSHKNLNLVTVYNAGHMVPYNQPGPALDMLTRFLNGESYHDSPLTSYGDRTLPITTDVKEHHHHPAHTHKHSDTEERLYQSVVPPTAATSSIFGDGVGSMAAMALTAIAAVMIAFFVGVWTAKRSNNVATAKKMQLRSGQRLDNYSDDVPSSTNPNGYGSLTIDSIEFKIKRQGDISPFELLSLQEQQVDNVSVMNRLTISETRRRLGSPSPQSQNNGEDNNHRRLNFMAHDTPWSVTPYIGQLLDEANIQVLIYSGDRDIICCTQGSEEALRKMDWSGTREIPPGAASATPQYNAWTAAPRGLWMYNDYPAGYVKSHKNLSLVTVYNAGHMVPYNQPGPALDMLTRFLNGESYHDRPLTSYGDRTLPITTDVKEHHHPAHTHKHSDAEERLYQSVVPSTAATSSIFGDGVGSMAAMALTAIAAVMIAFFVGVWTAKRSNNVAAAQKMQLRSGQRLDNYSDDVPSSTKPKGYGSLTVDSN
eukprot:CAMPEP_0113494036 /NCGR_PEP_ID=MMETSP0014_2-20120614/28902_1 /TAXON_ID=2857 /ORGANISM="Nitzschia sp." /LENGTH=1012 /DNA_ID=CAMNT_0000387921 /DNA_START=167 /DNA_END=3207 /DNA_ORIENTATION=- /assembly_acc=CAM_ASM_000159